MKGNNWVVAARVADSIAAARTDPSGDMEMLELMELILVSEHATKEAAEETARLRRSAQDGWVYVVMSRREFNARAKAA
ncbi:MAG: hypothetical protein AB1749_05795 [Pseudomonadota bacterium]